MGSRGILHFLLGGGRIACSSRANPENRATSSRTRADVLFKPLSSNLYKEIEFKGSNNSPPEDPKSSSENIWLSDFPPNKL